MTPTLSCPESRPVATLLSIELPKSPDYGITNHGIMYHQLFF